MKWLFLAVIILITCTVQAQEINQKDVEALKQEILKLNEEVDQIQLNLQTSQKKFQKGILVATIGYSVTIAGGLMLGRKNDDLGKVLLVTGGVTGITGTFMMVDAFKYLNRKQNSTSKQQ